MKNFLLTLFILASPSLYALANAWKSLCSGIKGVFISLYKRSVNAIKNFFISIWRFITAIERFSLKILWFYPLAAFVFCIIISEKYPYLPYTDYVWTIFFVVMMISLLIYSIKNA
jgi:hypothetical protein